MSHSRTTRYEQLGDLAWNVWKVCQIYGTGRSGLMWLSATDRIIYGLILHEILPKLLNITYPYSQERLSASLFSADNSRNLDSLIKHFIRASPSHSYASLKLCERLCVSCVTEHSDHSYLSQPIRHASLEGRRKTDRLSANTRLFASQLRTQLGHFTKSLGMDRGPALTQIAADQSVAKINEINGSKVAREASDLCLKNMPQELRDEIRDMLFDTVFRSRDFHFPSLLSDIRFFRAMDKKYTRSTIMLFYRKMSGTSI